MTPIIILALKQPSSHQIVYVQGPESKLTSRLPVSDDSTTEDEAECVPGTPPSKKVNLLILTPET